MKRALFKPAGRVAQLVTLGITLTMLVAVVSTEASAGASVGGGAVSAAVGIPSATVTSAALTGHARVDVVSTKSAAVFSGSTRTTGARGRRHQRNPQSTTTTTVPPTTTTTAVTPGVPQPVGGAPGPWRLVFNSEFTGTSLNASQWSTGWFGAGITKGINSAEIECMDPSQVVVSGGALQLTAIHQSETCGGVTQPYTSGMVTTDGRFSFTYGYMEARIWMPGNGSVADWPGFWADGQSWPTDGEIDVAEGLGGTVQGHFHFAGGTDGPIVGPGNYTGGWHTFAADWEPGSITYYYDGIKIGTFTSGITSAPMYLILDLALSNGPSVVAPATMKVAYVRVWQH